MISKEHQARWDDCVEMARGRIEDRACMGIGVPQATILVIQDEIESLQATLRHIAWQAATANGQEVIEPKEPAAQPWWRKLFCGEQSV